MAHDDTDIEPRLRAGEESALAELFERHRPRLARMVELRLDPRLRQRIDPDDVLQETFLAARTRLDSFREQVELSPFVWLRLLAGQCLTENYRRHIGAQRRTAADEIHLPGAGPTAHSGTVSIELVAALSSPSQVAIRGEEVNELTAALDAMDPIDREVLVLRHFEELSNGEVAALLGIQKTAASNRYIRALDRLRALMPPPS